MKSGTMKQTLKGGALEKITARNTVTKYTGVRGLYSSFVRGGVMEGSANDPAASLPTPPDSGAGTPLATTDSETKDGERGETKEERRARREAKRLRKAEKEARKRAAEKVEKKKAKKAERRAAKEKRRAGESKEERRARRDARRRRKEEKRRG